MVHIARKLTGNPVGPVPKEIDWDLFEQLCGIQCTQSEIASMLKIDSETLRFKCRDRYGVEYPAIYKKYSEIGKCSLRRYQFIQAKTKPNMAIWLGKQILGQKENVSDLKELVVHELRAGIRYLSEESGGEATEQPTLEIEQLISNS